VKNIDSANVDVEIQSLGGDVLQAFAIHDAIKRLPQRVTTRMVGSTASAGTVIAMAGDEREITPNSRFLIHNSSTVTMGDAEDHEKTAEILKSIDDQLAGIYQKATGRHRSTMRNLMAEEKWLTASEAKELGFVSKITKSKVVNEKTETMTEDLMKLLKVTNEVDLLKATNDLVEELEKKDEIIAELEAKVKDFEVAETQAFAEDVNEFLTNAVKEGKIKEDTKDKWFNLAQADFEAVRSTIDSIVIPEKSIEAEIEAVAVPELPAKEKFYKNWREGHYEKNPEQYKNDFEAAFGT
jgi:ATP-dependent protease ClpP protease subunit